MRALSRATLAGFSAGAFSAGARPRSFARSEVVAKVWIAHASVAVGSASPNGSQVSIRPAPSIGTRALSL